MVDVRVVMVDMRVVMVDLEDTSDLFGVYLSE